MRLLTPLFATAYLLAGAAPAIAADWPLLTPAERSLARPKIDPNADAEVLRWEVRITDSDERDELATIEQHFIRIKIFTDRGREDHGKVDITYTPQARVRDVAARTIAADGTITEVKNSDIFDRTIVEASGLKLKAKGFVFPAVTPGAIIEYQWREIHDNTLSNDVELEFQRDIPVHSVKYLLKALPVRAAGFQMRTVGFNLKEAPIMTKEPNGYGGMEMRDVPALRREPLMPPTFSVSPWMLVYYADLANDRKTADRFWRDVGREMNSTLKPAIRVTSDIRRAAAEMTKGATTVDEKVDAILRDLRQRIKRLDATSDNESANDTLKKGVGDDTDLRWLFVALATAAGLDARPVLLPDRSEYLGSPEHRQPYFVRYLAAAVRNGTDWRFVDASNRLGDGGRLEWRHDGQYALLVDDEAALVPVRLRTPDASNRQRRANLTLSESGTLEGDVTLQYTGLEAMRRRDRDTDLTAAEREQAATEDFARRIPGSQISQFTTEHADDPDQPYTVRYHITIPGYAQRAGSRLLLQPGLMQRGADPLLSAATRTHQVYFPFAWSEDDEIVIQLPAGFDIEGNAPGAALEIAGGQAAKHEARTAFDAATRRFTYTRSFFLGGAGRIVFAPGEYTMLKTFTDGVHQRDGYTVTLRRPAAGAAQ